MTSVRLKNCWHHTESTENIMFRDLSVALRDSTADFNKEVTYRSCNMSNAHLLSVNVGISQLVLEAKEGIWVNGLLSEGNDLEDQISPLLVPAEQNAYSHTRLIGGK